MTLWSRRQSHETASKPPNGNRFFYNAIGTVFGGPAKQSAWSLRPAGLTYAGGSGCSVPRGRQRLRTGGNT